MLDNSTRHEGETATKLNKLIRQYEDINIQLNDLETTKKEVLAEIFAIAQLGINETNCYVFNVCNNSGRVSIAPKKLFETAPDIYSQIEKLNLITTGKDYLTVRGIKKRTDV